MALATTVTGSGKQVSREVVSRDYIQGFSGIGFWKFRETTETETREWVALTQTAANDAADANAQPETGTYTYYVAETNRIVGAYSLTRVYHNTSTEIVTEPEE